MNENGKDPRNIELTVAVSDSKHQTLTQPKGKNWRNKQYISQIDKEDVDNIEKVDAEKFDGSKQNVDSEQGENAVNKDGEETGEEKAVKKTSAIDRIINELGINKYNMRIYLILSLFFLADGAEMIVISLLISKLGVIWDLSHTQKGLMGSAVFVGFFIGALVSGKLSDTKGRKPTFIIGSLIVCVFATGSAFAPNYTTFLILRALNGLGIGMSIPSCTSLVTEITPTAYRAWVLNLVWIFFPFGEIFAIMIAESILDYPIGWRYLLGFAGLPSILAFAISFFIFESPKYYLATKNYEKAFYGINRMLSFKKLAELTPETKEQIIKENEESSKSSIKPAFSTLFKKDYLGLTIKCCFIFFACSFIYYGVVYIMPQTMEQVALEESNSTITNITNSTNITQFGSEEDQDITTMSDSDKADMYNGLILSALSEIPSTLLTGYFSNLYFLGRLGAMIIGFGMTGISAISCGIFLKNLTIPIILLKFSIEIPFGVIYLYISEAFPTKIRTIANGATNAFNRIGGITTPILSQLAFSIATGLPYYMYAFVAAMGLLVTYLLPFETLGRDLH